MNEWSCGHPTPHRSIAHATSVAAALGERDRAALSGVRRSTASSANPIDRRCEYRECAPERGERRRARACGSHRQSYSERAMHCPSLTIFGAFFPSWMLCAVIGVVAAVVMYVVLSRTRLGGEVKPALLAYPSIAFSVTFLLWLTFYGH
jgi:hypothetical protein